MRRFSQRNPLVTLSDLNITPLLDLAFVLLIIFVITTQSMEQGMNLNLPAGGSPDSGTTEKEDIQTVEFGSGEGVMLNGSLVSMPELESKLVQEFGRNPNMAVYIRGDQDETWGRGYAILDICLRNNITRFNLRSQPKP